MQKVRYGVIGLGFFGEKHAEVVAHLPDAELAAICTRRDAHRQDLKQRFGVPRDYADYRDLLADPDIDAVSVVTHVGDHCEPTVAALEAGKHVLLEKPMAASLAECDRMIAAAEEHRRILMVGHICRFNPRYAAVQKAVRAGEIGEVVSLYARRNIPAQRSRTVLEQIGPILGDGIHDTDLFLWIAGKPIASAQAATHSVRNLPHPDIAWTTYRFADGALGVLENVWFLPGNTPFRIHEQLEVIGTEGAIYVQGNDMNVTVYGREQTVCPDTVYWSQVNERPAGALKEEIAYFVDCVRTGEPPTLVTPQEARAAVAATLAAGASAAAGKPVSVSA